MSTSLSKLVNNLSEIYSQTCSNKKWKSEFKGIKKNKLSDNREQLKPINGLIKKFPNTYKFYNNDISNFILSLLKVFILINT